MAVQFHLLTLQLRTLRPGGAWSARPPHGRSGRGCAPSQGWDTPSHSAVASFKFRKQLRGSQSSSTFSL